MNVVETILHNGQGSAAAILYKDSVVTYEQLRAGAARLAGALLARGYRKGDRVGILSENSPFFVTVYLALLRAGMVAVPLPTELTAESFKQCASAAGTKAVFTSDRFFERVSPWAKDLGIAAVAAEQDAGPPRPSVYPAVAELRDLASLMFTSGATGSPKAVMVSHRNIECNARDILAYMGLSPADRVMVVLPFHYCFGLSLLHSHLMAGATLVLNNEFRLFPESTLSELQQKQCTGFAGVPSTYQILLRRTRFRQLDFPKLRWFQQAGGSLPNPCIQEIRAAFPKVKFFVMYGQTEGTARLSYLPPDRLDDKLGSVGKGLPSTRLEVRRQDGTSVKPGSDETGEIVAAGDNITLGYWKDPLETAKTFRQGWLHTGDLGQVDAEGFIFVVDREKDIIKSGGNRVGAKEIEDVIAELPEVVQVAVVGTPDDLLGEAINALVVPAPDTLLKPEHVATHCRRRLPAFKSPRTVVFLRCMPQSSSGKILKPKLKEMLTHGPSPPDRGPVLAEGQAPAGLAITR